MERRRHDRMPPLADSVSRTALDSGADNRPGILTPKHRSLAGATSRAKDVGRDRTCSRNRCEKRLRTVGPIMRPVATRSRRDRQASSDRTASFAVALAGALQDGDFIRRKCRPARIVQPGENIVDTGVFNASCSRRFCSADGRCWCSTSTPSVFVVASTTSHRANRGHRSSPGNRPVHPSIRDLQR